MLTRRAREKDGTTVLVKLPKEIVKFLQKHRELNK